MFKPRFNRSDPTVLKASELRKTSNKCVSQDQKSNWRPVSIKTLGYLAATAKIGILQVHQRLGDRYNKAFAKSFLDSIDLRSPDKRDMEQIQLFSHLLFA